MTAVLVAAQDAPVPLQVIAKNLAENGLGRRHNDGRFFSITCAKELGG